MSIAVDNIRAITESVWESTLGAAPTHAPPPPEPPARHDSFVACVHITGAWTGAVTIECSPSLAKSAAGAMLDCPPEAASHEDVRDALGELTNMVGGNIKGLIPGTTQLSLPAVARGSLDVPGSSLLHEVWFDWAGEAFTVRLLKRDSGRAPAKGEGA